MALARTHLNSGTGTSSAAASITPTANAWLVATVLTRRNGTTGANTPTCTGGGTWTQIANGVQTTTNSLRLTVFKIQAGVSPGTFTVTAAATSSTSMAISIEQCTGSTPDLSNVSAVGINPVGDPLAHLPANPLATSIVLGAFGALGPTSITLPAGYTQIDQQLPTGARLNICDTTGTTDFDAIWTSNGAESAAALLEFKLLVPEAHSSGIDITIPASFTTLVAAPKKVGGLVGIGPAALPMTWNDGLMVWGGALMTWSTVEPTGIFYASAKSGPAGTSSAYVQLVSSFASRGAGGRRVAASLAQSAVASAFGNAGGVGSASQLLAATATADGRVGARSSAAVALASSSAVSAAGGQTSSASVIQTSAFAAATVPTHIGAANVDQASSFAATAGVQRATGASVQQASTQTAAAAGGQRSTGDLTQTSTFAASAGLQQRAGWASVDQSSTFAANAGVQQRSTSASVQQTSTQIAVGVGGEAGSASPTQIANFSATAEVRHGSDANVTLTTASPAVAAGGQQSSATLIQGAVFFAAAAQRGASTASVGQTGVFTARAAGGQTSRTSIAQDATFAAATAPTLASGADVQITASIAAAGSASAGSSSSYDQASDYSAAGAYGRTGSASPLVPSLLEASGRSALHGDASVTQTASFSAQGLANAGYNQETSASFTIPATASARGAGGERAGADIDIGNAIAPPMTWLSASMTWVGALMTWGAVPSVAGIFYAKGTAALTPGDARFSGANVNLVANFVARAAGGEQGASANLLASAGAPVQAVAGRQASASPVQPAAFFVQGAGFSADAYSSGASVTTPASFAAWANGGEAGAGSLGQTAVSSAAGAYGRTGTASPLIPGTTTADAQDAAWSTASVAQGQSFSAKGLANAGYNQETSASFTIPATFFASAASAGVVSGTLTTANTSSASAGSGHASSIVEQQIEGGFAAVGVIGARGNADSTTIAAGFDAVVGEAAHGSGATLAYVTDLRALGRIGAGSGCFVILSVAASAVAGAMHQGRGGAGQAGTAPADAHTGGASSGGLASTLTFGAAFGDIARPYVQILRCDAIVLPAANVDCTVRTSVAVEALVTAVERSG